MRIRVGNLIHKAVVSTNELLGKNTNLGIILLLTPLACVYPVVGFRSQLPLILKGLTQEDAKLVFEAIRIASPGGLGDAVDSWISTGENKSVEPAAIGQALGPETVQQLATGSGISAGELLPMLAAFLPKIVDMLTPKGHVPSGGLGGAMGGLEGLGSLIGGLASAAGSGGTGGASEIGSVLGELGGLLGEKKGS